MIQEDIDFENLKKHTINILKIDMYEKKSIHKCPHCNSENYIKFGKYNNIQRYKCRKCKKTFSKTTKTLWSYSKKDSEKWIKFTELMFQKKSLRACAKILNINIRTAFIWRHKIMNEIIEITTPGSLRGNIFITKTIEKENFKGCRNITVKERKNIWIIAAKDRRDSLIIKPICKQCWNKNNFNKIIYSKIEKDSYIIPDNDSYIMYIAKKHNKEIILNSKIEKSMKYFRRKIRNWLGIFHGVATKYLEKYLAYYTIFNLYKNFNSIDFTYHLCTKEINSTCPTPY